MDPSERLVLLVLRIETASNTELEGGMSLELGGDMATPLFGGRSGRCMYPFSGPPLGDSLSWHRNTAPLGC